MICFTAGFSEHKMFRIKKLDIYIAKQFGLLFFGAFFICQFVLMMQFLWRYVDDLIGKGLSMEVLAEFFFHMGMMLVPQALPLAILLSSLITFGNLGENSELTAIKAAGISLLQAFRPLIVLSAFIMCLSFYFQNEVAPRANQKIRQMLIGMKQKSPELEIPEGIFYDGIQNCNIYVQKKDVESGKLYGIMIYRMTGSYEDQAIILADSGMIQTTAEKKHLVLTLYDGEWFENMQSQELANSASVPYRRETFAYKKVIIDDDTDFSEADAGTVSGNAQGKSLSQISASIDSMSNEFDSVGRENYKQLAALYYQKSTVSKADSLKAVRMAQTENIDSVFARLSVEQRQHAVGSALSQVRMEQSDLEFRSMVISDGDNQLRRHKIEYVNKFTSALSCMIFFFIGAPLGAIIRKGGLGLPVIISVLVFIVYYILDNTGYRMARIGEWAIWFGKGLAPAVLIPLAAFVTWKALNDSAVFNADAYKRFFMHLFGIQEKRHIQGKEVVIEEPHYADDAVRLGDITRRVKEYNDRHSLKKAPNPVDVFFKYHPDHVIEEISNEMEKIIEDLGNTRDKQILVLLNRYPVLAVKAHTRPFERRWMNIVAAVVIPAGLFFYFRMWRYRLRLWHDLNVIARVDDSVIDRIGEMKDAAGTNGKQ